MHVKGDWSTLQPDFVLNGETLTTEPIVYNFRDTSFEYHIPANPKTALEQELANAYQRQIVDKGEEAGKKAEEVLKPLTLMQLDIWGCKYHELIMGKPHADLFIDDKGINCDDFFKD